MRVTLPMGESAFWSEPRIFVSFEPVRESCERLWMIRSRPILVRSGWVFEIFGNGRGSHDDLWKLLAVTAVFDVRDAVVISATIDIDDVRFLPIGVKTAVFQQPSARVPTKTYYKKCCRFVLAIGRFGGTVWSSPEALSRISSTAAHQWANAVSGRPTGCGDIYIVPELPNTVSSS